MPVAAPSYQFILRGHVPAKKNRWHRARAGGMYFDRAGIDEALNSLTLQARVNWLGEPLSCPEVGLVFFVRDGKGDLDNKTSTVLDCLVKAGVLTNDSIAHLPGPLTARAQVDPDERTIVVLTGGKRHDPRARKPAKKRKRAA